MWHTEMCRLHEHRYVTSLSLILNYWSNPLRGQRVHCVHSSAFNRSPLKYLTQKRETGWMKYEMKMFPWSVFFFFLVFTCSFVEQPLASWSQVSVCSCFNPHPPVQIQLTVVSLPAWQINTGTKSSSPVMSPHRSVDEKDDIWSSKKTVWILYEYQRWQYRMSLSKLTNH